MQKNTGNDDYFNQIQESEPRRFGLLDYLLRIAAGAIIVAMYVFVVNRNGRFGTLHYLINGFFVVGIVYFAIGTFSLINHEGFFDSGAYAIKAFFSLRRMVFQRNSESKSKETYADFVEKRRRKRKGVRHPYLSIGGAFMLISIVLMYYSGNH